MMKIRTKFFLFVIIIHGITLVMSWFIFKQNKILFITAEAFVLVSIYVAWQLYNQLIQPLRLLLQGASALREKDFNIKFAHTGQYEMDELIQVYNQMIDALRGERTKQEQQHFFLEKMIATSPTGILVMDYDENLQGANPSALRMLGLTAEAIQGQSINTIDHPLLRQIQQLPSGTATTASFNGINTFKLQKSHFIDRGFPRHFVMIEEVTAAVLMAEKKAYGKVIRMMAHEVNNTIGPVNSIIQSALNAKKIWTGTDTDPLRNALQVAHNRNNNLSIFMRNFADVVKLPAPNKSALDLHQLIRNTAYLLENMAGQRQISFTYVLDETPFTIMADEQQMEHVLINIVKNSIEAVEDHGHITITTHTADKQLVISDNGKGISAAHAAQLFSPFFSTKKEGQGIGLTLVKEILIGHGCEFSLQTLRPGYTAFSLRFEE